MTSEVGTPQPQLKRLGFVQNTAKLAYNVTGNVEKLYKSVRSLTPQFVEPTVSNIEDKVVAYTAPVVAKSQDLGDKLLHTLDDQVCPSAGACAKAWCPFRRQWFT